MKDNKNKKELLIMAMLTIIISAGVTTAFAHRGLDSEVRDGMDAAIESGDYQAWSQLQPTNSPMQGLITEDNFDRLTEMHEAMQSGDIETAETIREELGVNARFGQGRRDGSGEGLKTGFGKGHRMGSEDCLNNK